VTRTASCLAALFLSACAAGQGASSATATAEACAADPAHWVRGTAGCLAMASFGPARADTLAVVLHGDVSGGGPATYHLALAQRVAATLPGASVAALIRPGYSDGEGRTSAGELRNRSDHYTAGNVELVASAIAELKRRTGARRVVAIGHSGGAATVADILALNPGVIDSAVLLACPCDLTAWRGARQPWVASVSPMSVADRVPPSAFVRAYTGTADTNTSVALAENYVLRLAANRVDAQFVPVPGATHNGVVDAVWGVGLAQTLAQAAAR
jgi:pimeloyl-ACP methyl ester carboxylesterase